MKLDHATARDLGPPAESITQCEITVVMRKQPRQMCECDMD
jgi:hypothetical protein